MKLFSAVFCCFTVQIHLSAPVSVLRSGGTIQSITANFLQITSYSSGQFTVLQDNVQLTQQYYITVPTFFLLLVELPLIDIPIPLQAKLSSCTMRRTSDSDSYRDPRSLTASQRLLLEVEKGNYLLASRHLTLIWCDYYFMLVITDSIMQCKLLY